MGSLVVQNRVIDKDIIDILYDVQRECRNGKLSNFRKTSSGISVQCPHHAGGRERHNSCYINVDDENVEYGICHCFTCGFTASFPKFVGECFDRSEEYGENWLIANYASEFIRSELNLPKIELNENSVKYIDESILDKFESYHPYMTQRKISDDIIKKFDLKYDPETQSIVFPVRDKYGRLKFLTRRSVVSKRFLIDKNADKSDVYGLYEIVKDNIREVVVTESQINCLTSWSYGYPAIALLGAGTTKEQMNVLNNTSVRHWILCYDGDDAGDRGANKFIKLAKPGVFIDMITMERGKDLNDLSKEEFEISLHNAKRII